MSDYIYKPPASLPRGSSVIAYCRDSGGPNQEGSIGQQTRAIGAFCEEHGLILRPIYSDTASGRKTKNRSQFLEMFNDVMTMPKESLPAGLLLWAYSRFSRDTTDFNYYLSGLQMKGLTVHSLTEEIPEGMAGQIMLSVKSYTNADYSIQLGKQIKRGIADRVRAGYCNGGQAPRGYRVVRDNIGVKRNGTPRDGIKWEIDPELAPLVKLAFELRAQGKGYGAITKATGGKVYTNSGSWLTCFRNESYLGIGKAGKEIRIPDHHEAIITYELFEAVKNVEKLMPRHGVRGHPIHPRRMSNPSLLSGIAFCVHCGAAMVLHTAKDYRSYLCGKRDRQKGYQDCAESRNVNARKADRLILDTILNRILSPSFVEDLLAEIQSQMSDTNKIDREIGDASNLLIHAERSITRLLQLAEGTGDIEEITARVKILKQEKGEYIEKIKRMKAERAVEMPEITPEALDLVFSIWRDQIEKAIKSNEILTAKKLLTQFVSKIELSKEAAIIHYTYPVRIPSSEENHLFSAHSAGKR